MKFIDAAPIAGTRRTADGYLVAEVRTARTGIQDYAGYEVGKPDSFLNVAATLDGLTILDLWDGDDAITVEQGADVGTGLVGVDGSAIFSQSADRSAKITIRVKHTSPTHRQLTEKWKQQRAGRLVAFPFDFIDKGSGEGGTADQCFIMQAPTDQKGKNAVVRAWVIWTGEYEPGTPNG